MTCTRYDRYRRRVKKSLIRDERRKKGLSSETRDEMRESETEARNDRSADSYPEPTSIVPHLFSSLFVIS